MDAHAEGTELGRYRLGRLIGSGGMGEVYLARDASLRRDVAIKFVNATAGSSDVVTRRLLQEAQAVAALDHPGICPVHDVGTDSTGRPYMVMQYVPGETLASRLARGPLPVADTLRISAQIADALAAAHRRGIIHRDLKPQNVMLTPSGQPKLLDFGIAKVIPSAETGATGTTITSLTQAHGVVGTPAYMSPEQIQQQPLDGRSDLFSLGCILFECLTGHRAFGGQQNLDVLGQVLHVQPPAPSTVRPELDPRHDELCRRLLAKDPAERFQSAEEVVGALGVLQGDSSRDERRDVLRAVRTHWKVTVAATVVAIAAVVGAWIGMHPRLPTPTADAAHFYQLGTDALREGAFHSAAAALTEAVRLFPSYPLAYARLAEAHAEMDDGRAAAQDLLNVSTQVPDTTRLPRDEQLRFDAIRALVMGQADAAVDAYRELAKNRPGDPGAWVDLARAQEAAAQLIDARASAERAIAIDKLYAPAHLRLGIVEGFLGHKDQGLAALAEAGRLYGLSQNKEGKTEVLIRQGALLSSVSEFAAAREALERARESARTFDNSFQIVRAEMLLGSAMVSGGQFNEAEQIVAAAVKRARDDGLETVAADGLIDLSAALLSPSHLDEAESHLLEAIALASRRVAQRTVARAQTQLASVRWTKRASPNEVLQTLEPALEFFRQHKYRKLELVALAIAARAYVDLDDIAKARELATQGLTEAEATGDASQLSIALTNLASQATVLGSLPEALALRGRAETIHRHQQDAFQLSYDLTNRAEALINLGRFEEAEGALREIDDGVKKGLEVYLPRQRRVAYLRALAAVLSNHFSEAASSLAAIPSGPASSSTTVLGSILSQYVDAKLGRAGVPESLPETDPGTSRERLYWLAQTRLARGQKVDALAAAVVGVEQARKIGSDEMLWRFAAVGSVAARSEGKQDQQRALRSEAVAALSRLRGAWGEQIRSYVRRPDLVELRKASELED